MTCVISDEDITIIIWQYVVVQKSHLDVSSE